MRVVIAAVGRLKSGPDSALFERYIERARTSGRACGLTGMDLIELGESKLASPAERMAAEGEALLAKAKLAAADRLVCLDERGAQPTSVQFADLVGRTRDQGCPRLVFAIGGADGHDQAMRRAAHETIALSALTLPHGLARIVLAEQIYRAVTILTGHPYHRA